MTKKVSSLKDIPTQNLLKAKIFLTKDIDSIKDMVNNELLRRINLNPHTLTELNNYYNGVKVSLAKESIRTTNKINYPQILASLVNQGIITNEALDTLIKENTTTTTSTISGGLRLSSMTGLIYLLGKENKQFEIVNCDLEMKTQKVKILNEEVNTDDYE
jgi:hypothetical protein